MEKTRLSEEELLEKIAALEEQNKALNTAVETGVKPIVGKFKATLKIKGKAETLTFGLKEGHHKLICCTDARNRDAESLIAVANGKEVEGFDLDTETAKAELQHLVDIEYTYLIVIAEK